MTDALVSSDPSNDLAARLRNHYVGQCYPCQGLRENAAAALESQAKRIEELERELAEATEYCQARNADQEADADEIEQLEAEIATRQKRHEEALEYWQKDSAAAWDRCEELRKALERADASFKHLYDYCEDSSDKRVAAQARAEIREALAGAADVERENAELRNSSPKPTRRAPGNPITAEETKAPLRAVYYSPCAKHRHMGFTESYFGLGGDYDVKCPVCEQSAVKASDVKGSD